MRPAAVAQWRDSHFLHAVRSLGWPKVLVMLALGVSAGLPFMLIGNTLGFWLARDNIKVAAIGYLSWAGLAYLWKFVWGAVVDHVPPPVLKDLGRRRAWLILTQVATGLGLIGMALSGPRHLEWLAVSCVATAIAAAMQDTVVDAWRIETAADGDELRLLTTIYSLGFRIALVFTEGAIVWVAGAVGWALSYAISGAAMLIGVVASSLAPEPQKADAAMAAHEAGQSLLRRGVDALWGPLVSFFRSHGADTALLMLLLITLYHLSDYMRGPMGNPYYTRGLGIAAETVAFVRTFIGSPMTFLGIALGGVMTLRLGIRVSLVIGAVLQPVAVGAFALLALHHGDYALVRLGDFTVSAFPVIMGFDSLAMGMAGVVLVAYMSSLTSLGYTATQYALMTSAMALTGKTLKGFSGRIVEAIQAKGMTLTEAYGQYYLLAAAIGVPAILVCLWLLALQARRAAQSSDAMAPSS